MATAVTALATITLGASQNSITFSSIPSTYRDLYLVITGLNPSAAITTLRFNGDTGSNYTSVYMAATASTTSTSTLAAGTSMSMQANGAGNSSFVSSLLIHVLDYAATDKHKMVLSHSNAKDNASVLEQFAGRWASTAAITSLSLQGGTSQFGASTTATLYGIAG